ncbi:uncharacterized protein ASPGLDRAFT_41882 [Aspergillus glaucus CBS 516.65]|uniref:Uncharacterized protein n=1 Tax=Aspergillus glaucus CBS 516.65 TaxID=1160497 RepID=A0A1L9VWP7_ASPGL|nr:hypothetical protein ASPGLDRAFT_41882 [Aspergillus glaucus CBS 516.65]OJJ88325.1 hypothetical protein ASPGLDRAFT_41882 [Aspergillus glaucus CBS 516.65]
MLEGLIKKAEAASDFVWTVAKYICEELSLLWPQKLKKDSYDDDTAKKKTVQETECD